MPPISAADIKATQDSAIFDALVDLCGSVITAPQVDKINAALQQNMRTGNMAHAFDPEVIKLRLDPPPCQTPPNTTMSQVFTPKERKQLACAIKPRRLLSTSERRTLAVMFSALGEWRGAFTEDAEALAAYDRDISDAKTLCAKLRKA